MEKFSPVLFITLNFSGAALSLLWLRYLRRTTLHRQKQWLSAALLLAAGIYVIFAIFSGDMSWVIIELLGMAFFLLFVVLASKYSYWFLSIGWVIHGFWNAGILPTDIAPYVPHWYVPIAIGFDVVIAAYVTFKIAPSRQ